MISKMRKERPHQLSDYLDINHPLEFDGAISTLEEILKVWKNTQDFSVLKNLKVLDLASGAGTSHDNIGSWDPHFSRICALSGAKVIAIDLCPQTAKDLKLFKGLTQNLVVAVVENRLHKLPILKNKKFDLIHSSNFIGFNAPPQLEKQLSAIGISQSEFDKMLFDQASKLLAKNGLMMLDIRDNRFDRVFHTNKQGIIVPLPKPSSKLRKQDQT